MWLRRERYDFYLLKILLLSRKDTTIRSQVIGLQSYLTCLRFYLTCLEIYPACSFFYPINKRSHAESIPKSEGHPTQAEQKALFYSLYQYVFYIFPICTTRYHTETYHHKKGIPNKRNAPLLSVKNYFLRNQ